MKSKVVKHVLISVAVAAVGAYLYYKFSKKTKKSVNTREKAFLLKLLKQRKRHLFSIADYFSFLFQSNAEENSFSLNPRDRLAFFNFKST